MLHNFLCHTRWLILLSSWLEIARDQAETISIDKATSIHNSTLSVVNDQNDGELSGNDIKKN